MTKLVKLGGFLAGAALAASGIAAVDNALLNPYDLHLLAFAAVAGIVGGLLLPQVKAKGS